MTSNLTVTAKKKNQPATDNALQLRQTILDCWLVKLGQTLFKVWSKPPG
jgi:hypothetical protein